jgi:hypothetical protein
VIPLQKGPSSDLFFLTFEQIGTQTHAVTEPAAAMPAPAVDSAAQPDVGLRTFGAISATMAKITGVSPTVVKPTFDIVKQQLPAVSAIKGFVSAHQAGITQLALAYCSAVVDDSTLRAAFFPGLNLSATLANASDRNALIDPLVAKTVGSGALATAPQPADVKGELSFLIDDMCPGGACTQAGRTTTVAKAVCGAALANAVTLIN